MEETINREVYTVTKLPSGHIVRELKMTEEQRAILKNQPQPKSELEKLAAKIDALTAEVALLQKG